MFDTGLASHGGSAATSVATSDGTYRVSQRRALAKLLDSRVNELRWEGVADDFILRLMDLSDGEGMNLNPAVGRGGACGFGVQGKA